mmetsp:Transcript_21731/g.66500  ORF Transcript_21731/g.66500 Transcript_21731/m.66500 type:complete len:653 (-) Transcript_21731:17-1975(-)
MLRRVLGGLVLGASLLAVTRGLSADRRRGVALHTLLAVVVALAVMQPRANAGAAGDAGGSTSGRAKTDEDPGAFWADIITGEHAALEAREYRKRRRQLLRICRRETAGRPRMQPLPLSLKPKAVRKGGRRGDTFNVVSWNILAQSLVGSDAGFGLAAEETLAWSFRRWRLLEALASIFFDDGDDCGDGGADIICLQECDKFHSWFAHMLGYIGYEGIFSIAGGAADEAAPATDKPPKEEHGVAIFYRFERFELLDAHRTGGKYNGGPPDADSYRGCFVRLRRRQRKEGGGAAAAEPTCALEVQRPYASLFADASVKIHLRSYALPEAYILNRIPFYILESPPGGLAAGGEPVVVGKATFSNCLEYASYVQYCEDAALHGQPCAQPQHGPAKGGVAGSHSELDLYAMLSAMSAAEGGDTPAPPAQPSPRRQGNGTPCVGWSPGRRTFGWVMDACEYYAEGDPRRRPLPLARLRRRYRSLYEIAPADEIVVASCHLNSKKDEEGQAIRLNQIRRLYRELHEFISKGSPSSPRAASPVPTAQPNAGDANTALEAHPFLGFYQIASGKAPSPEAPPSELSLSAPPAVAPVPAEHTRSLGYGYGAAEIVLAGDFNAQVRKAPVLALTRTLTLALILTLTLTLTLTLPLALILTLTIV